jgi:hypothetical protein
MRVLRGWVLVILALVPLATLFHRDVLGQWDVQRSAMAAPDEFSYLLMAQHFMHGGGLSLQDQIGRDTYFPPGFPILLAAWGKCFGLTAFTAHALNAVLLCLATLVAYSLSRRLLVLLARVNDGRVRLSARVADVLALLVTGIFATNWHVLETSLLVMSEPAFMLVVLAWLALALRWPQWHSHPLQALVLVLLAVAAWSIRGAGITCVAATIVYPLWVWRKEGFSRAALLRHGVPVVLAICLPLAYQGVLTVLSPEKSVVSGEESANSYTKQLLHGLLETGEIKPGDARLPRVWLVKGAAIAGNLYRQVFGHLDDFSYGFVPWLRENPDMHFRDVAGKIFAFFALLGFAGHLLYNLRVHPPVTSESGLADKRESTLKRELRDEGGFLELFLLLYVGLYLLWPFNMPRFWSPILPVMLVYVADAVIRFAGRMKAIPKPALAAVLLALLFVLSAEEDILQLGNYARRLNYVSDALRDAAQTIVQSSRGPNRTLVAGMSDDELFAMAWYFSQTPGGAGAGYRVQSPAPHVAAKGGKRELAHEMLIRLYDEAAQSPGGKRLFFISYFPNADTRAALAQLAEMRHGTTDEPAAAVYNVYQKGAEVTVWEIAPDSVQRP